MPNRTTFTASCGVATVLVLATAVTGAARGFLTQNWRPFHPACGERPDDLATLDVPQLVCHYVTDERDRPKLLKLIREKAGGDAAPVLAALRAGNYWAEESAGPITFVESIPDAVAVGVHSRLPRGYNPSEARSLVVTWHDARPMDDIAAEFAPWWSDEVGEPIVAVLTSAIDTTFNRSAGQGELDRMLAAIRRMFHVNDARIAIVGPPHDRRSVWLVAAANAGEFAALFAEPNYPELPYPDVTFPILASSLRLTQLFLAGSSPRAEATDQPALLSLPETLARMNMPVQYLGGSAPENVADAAQRPSIAPNPSHREAVPTSIAHWFRFLEHGRVAWLLPTKFLDDPWEAEQISILPSAAVDRAEFIADVFKSQLAYVGGTIEGNDIRIETRRCAELDLLLFDGMVDLSKPVVVTINGRKRFERIVKPDVQTLLSELVQTHDFQRLVVARIRFRIRSEASDDVDANPPS